MTAADALARGRRLAETLRPDVGTIRRRHRGDGTIDPATLVLTPPDPTVVYTGACRVRAPTLDDTTRVFGDVPVTETSFVSTWAWNIPDVQVGDDVTVVSVGDPHVHTRTFRVVAVGHRSYLINRKVGMEEVSPSS